VATNVGGPRPLIFEALFMILISDEYSFSTMVEGKVENNEIEKLQNIYQT